MGYEVQVCLWCDEPLHGGVSSTPVHTEEGKRWMHIECALREVVGGIGHCLAHEYWCVIRHDPDANLTPRQSALLVQRFVELLGVEQAVDYSGRLES
jgi:hypothetical protein